MEQSPSWEANSRSASQEIPRLLRNPKVHYRVHYSPPLFPILILINTVHTFPLYFSKTHYSRNIVLPSTLRFFKWFFLSSSPRPSVTFRSTLPFHGNEMLIQHPTPRMEDYPISAVRASLFYTFVTIFHVWRRSPASATRGRAMPCWYGLVSEKNPKTLTQK
jgi:hypothetical protein